MAISTGFLRGQGFKPDKYLIFSWLVYMLIMSTLLHLLFVYIGEGLFVVTSHILFDYPIEIGSETQFYSHFLAGWSTVTAFGLSSILILRTTERSFGNRTKYNFRISQTFIGFNTWGTLLHLSRILTGLIILIAAMPSQQYSKIREEFGFGFYLLLIVMFLNNWLESHRVFKGNYFKYLGVSMLTVTLITISLAKIHPIDFEELNEKIKKKSFLINYDFDLPIVNSYEWRSAGGREETLFLTPNIGADLPLIFQPTNGRLVEVSADSIPKVLNDQGRFFDNEFQFYIDNDVPLFQIEHLIKMIKPKHLININHKVIPRSAEIESINFYSYNRVSIHESRMGSCQIEMDNIKNFKETKVNPKRIKWPKENPCYRLIDYKNYNRVLIEVEKDQLLLNRQEVDNNTLREVILSLFQKHRDRSLILFKPNLEISFGQYLTTLDEVRSTIIELREAYAMLEYGFDYDFHYRHYTRQEESEMIKDIEDQFPMHIILLKGWDLELYNYLNGKE